MSKIIKFQRTPAILYNKAIGEIQDNNLIQAINLLHTALALDPSNERMILDLGDTYLALNLPDEAFTQFIKIVSNHPNHYDANIGCANSLLMQNKIIPALAYFNKVLNKEQLDTISSPLKEFDIQSDIKKVNLKLYDRNDFSSYIQQAKQFIAINDLNSALSCFHKIPSYANEYIEAQSYIALIYLSNMDYQKSYEICNKVLQKDNNNIVALTTKMVACDFLEKPDEIKVLTKYIMSYEGDDLTTIMRIYHSAMQINNSVMIEKYAKKAIDHMNYDKELMLSYAISAYNNGNHNIAKEAIIKTKKLYPNDKIISYYAHEIMLKFNKQIENVYELPYHEQQERINYLNIIFSKLKNIKLIEKTYKTDAKFCEYINWALTCNQPQIQISVGNNLLQSKLFQKQIKALLVNNNLSINVKKQWLINYLLYSKDKSYILINDDILIKYNAKIPKVDTSFLLQDAYYIAYATISVLIHDFHIKCKAEKQLNRNFTDMTDLYELLYNRLSIYSANTLATIMASKLNIMEIFPDEKTCIQAFNCDITQYNDCKQIIKMETQND